LTSCPQVHRGSYGLSGFAVAQRTHALVLAAQKSARSFSTCYGHSAAPPKTNHVRVSSVFTKNL
jgi:hypothetical protein